MLSAPRVFLEEKYGFSNSEASIVNSLVYILSAAVSPFTGFMVDKVGFNILWSKYSPPVLDLAEEVGRPS